MTPPFSISDILNATGGELLTPEMNAHFSGVTIDSRKAGPEDLFVAIKGENHDGHDFLADVFSGGTTGVVVARKIWHRLAGTVKSGGGVCIGVTDTTTALGALARYHRQRFDLPVAAITGSNGKTATKEMTAAILRQKYEVLATAGNFNNEIGLPLTLFGLSATHGQAVVELGMNHPGEMTRLGNICLPDLGVITNVGHSHLEGLGSLTAVAQAKGELLDTLTTAGTAVLNADDEQVAALASRVRGDVIFFGTAEAAQVRGEDIRLAKDGVRFTLVLPDGRTEIFLPVPARFMVANALAAAAVAFARGLSGTVIASGLASFVPVKGRLNIRTSPGGIFIIDDTYNANPPSMAAAIETLVSVSSGKRKMACLGDMGELGNHAGRLHETVGQKAGKAGLDRLLVCGQFADHVVRGAVAGGMATEKIFVGTHEEIAAKLDITLAVGDWLLVKGSRFTRMENIVNHLMAENKTHNEMEMDQE